MKTLYFTSAAVFAFLLAIGQFAFAVDAVTPAADRNFVYAVTLTPEQVAKTNAAINTAIINADKAIDNAIASANQEIESAMTRAEKAAAAIFAEQAITTQTPAEKAARAAAAGMGTNALAIAGKTVAEHAAATGNRADTDAISMADKAGAAALAKRADRIAASTLPDKYMAGSNGRTAQAVALVLGIAVLAGLLYWASRMSKYNRENPDTIRPRDGSTFPRNEKSDLNPS